MLASAAIVLAICGAAGPAHALTANEKFVTKLYVDFVGRTPTSSELTWGAAVLGGGTSRSDYVDDLFEHSVVQSWWIKGVFQRYLVLDPTSSQVSAALADLQATGDFLDVELDVVAGSAYFGQAESDNSQFVESVYNDVLFREPDSSGWNYWTGQLNAATKTRRQVGNAIIRGSESAGLRVRGLGAQTSCLSTVLELSDDLAAGSYCLVLDRMADPSGALYWSTQLAGSAQLPVLWSSLASSPEYYNLAQV